MRTAGLTAVGARLAVRVRPWQIVALCALVYVLVTLARFGWDPMAFVLVGGHFDPRAPGGSLGYDGQFAYQIARDPWAGWRYVDVPAYRYQRILYPLLARVLSLGSASLVPWLLILINLAALPGGTALTEAFLVAHGTGRWYALTYGLYVGLLMPVRLDLTEPLAFLLVQAGVLAFSRDRTWLSAVWFALAALTRETTLLFALAYGLSLLFTGRRGRALGWGGMVVAPFLAWQVALRVWLGSWGVGSGGALSTPFECVPFRGWWIVATANPAAFVVMSLLVVPMALLPAVVSLVAALRDLVRGSRGPAVWALLTNALVFPFLPTSNVLDPLGLSRTTAGLVTAVVNYGGQQRARRALNYSLLWIITAVFLFKDSFLPRS